MNTYRNPKAMFVPSERVLDVQVWGEFYKSRAHCSTPVEGARAKKGQREVNPGVGQLEECRFCYNPALSTNHTALECVLNSPSWEESNGAI